MNYIIAFFGSVVYNFALFVIAKNLCDTAGVDFEYKKYLKMNWDNWALTILIAPILVWYMPDIFTIVNSKFNLNMNVYDLYYLGAGPLTEIVLFGMFKLMGWKKTWIAPVHKEN